MKIEEIFDYVTSEYEGVVIGENWGARQRENFLKGFILTRSYALFSG